MADFFDEYIIGFDIKLESVIAGSHAETASQSA
jgi:hypothetical protein